jgi:hypothetical protein
VVELVRVRTDHGRGAEVAEFATSHHVLVDCRDADTVLVVASWREVLHGDVGVWLCLGEAYPAQLAARDLKTLAALVPLARVVIEVSSRADQHAAIVSALLTNDEVNLTNDVATLRGAYNRPTPPRPIDVWRLEDQRVVSGEHTLAMLRRDRLEWGELTYFA